MSELKPCPFCGGKGEIEYRAKNALCDKVDHAFVRCIKCKGGWKPLNEWQSRPTEDLLTAENERLRQALSIANGYIQTLKLEMSMDVVGIENLIAEALRDGE